MPIYDDTIITIPGTGTKVIESNVGPFIAGVAHTLPVSSSYVLGSGANLDVIVNGQFLMEGATEDYIEDTTTTIKFNNNIGAGSNLTYIIR